MLRRTPFKRKVPAHQPSHEREPRPMARLDRTPNYGGSLTGVAVTKENPVRSEAYRRLVAALPCAHCRIAGYSQAAHPPPTAKGRKESDLACFPLCCTRPGVTGCHFEFDQYRLIPGHAMRTQAEKWAAQTRAAIRRSGDWPANLEDNGK